MSEATKARAKQGLDEDRFDDDLSREVLEQTERRSGLDATDPLGPDSDEATPGRVGLTRDALPDGPNEDMGNLAAPPPHVDMDRTSDDNDLNAEGSGLEDTPLRTPYESMARRDDIARQLEDLLVEVQEWADEDGSAESREVLDRLQDVFDLVGEPSEDSDT